MAEDSERRKVVRHRALKSARIVFNSGRSTIDCLVRNQSDFGARLKIDTVVGLQNSLSFP
jgi:hypothetical protein